MRIVLCAAAALLPLLPGAHALEAQEYHVDLEAERGVTFISRASIEEFEGVTDRIDGYVLLPARRLAAGMDAEGSELYFEVDLASLDTGIGLRNRHMRDNYLHTERFPFAVYRGRIAQVGGAEGGWEVRSRGTLEIHGVQRAAEIPCRVASEGEGYRTRCEFQVLLSDHDIDIPRVMFLKLANEIRLVVDFAVRPAG